MLYSLNRVRRIAFDQDRMFDFSFMKEATFSSVRSLRGEIIFIVGK